MDQGKINQWIADKGDTTLRINYDLNENSTIFDVGGYFGEWSEIMFDKYKCNIYIFEPVKTHYDYICKKFENLAKIKIFNLGISDSSRKAEINLLEYASSLCSSINGTRGIEEVNLIDINEFISTHNIDFIDVMKINIEGEEYPVLKRIINTNLQYKIDNIQIQFHDFITNHINLRKEIQENLSKSHQTTYNVDFIWENWKLTSNTHK